MQVIFNYDKQHSSEKPMAIALGTFDGLHIGHQMLIQQLMLLRRMTDCSTLVYTFLNNPRVLLEPEKAPPRIMNVRETIKKLNGFNIDFLILNTFDRDLASLKPEKFMKDMIIQKYNVKYVVVGYDFRFGFSGRGDTDLLEKLSQEYGYELIVVPPLALADQVISSSLIRNLIKDGDIGRVSMHLGGHYSISGKVVHGFGRGKNLGFPTANLQFSRQKLIPKNGVYLTKVKIRGIYYWGMTNVGVNPTFNKDGLFIETYILDYNDDLYGSKMKIEFFKRIRNEIRFTDIEDLKIQIKKDVQWAKNYVYKFN